MSPVLGTSSSDTSYQPTVSDVAALLQDRTRDDQGNLVGTFVLKADGRTTPTEENVLQYIQDAMSEAFPVFGSSVADADGNDANALRTAAKRVVALRAAALVELNHFKQEIARGTSSYAAYQQSFEDGLKRVGKAIGEQGVGDAIGTSDDSTVTLDNFGTGGGWGAVVW